MPALSVKSLHKSYGQLHAVNGVSFEVVRGDVFALLGPNGAGKSTTIEILEGFLKRDGGEVSVLGVDPGERGEQRWLRTRIGVVLQELTVEPFFSVRQVLERNAGYYPSPRAVDEVIELVGLRDKADVKVKKLSGGQQRRLDIGLGIVGNPELLFLDEPVSALDNRDLVALPDKPLEVVLLVLFAKLREQRTLTRLFRRARERATHDLHVERCEVLASKVVVEVRGRVDEPAVEDLHCAVGP